MVESAAVHEAAEVPAGSDGVGDVRRVGLVGSGIMAAGIAGVAARSGFEVVVRSRSRSSSDASLGVVRQDIAKLVSRGKLSAEDGDAALARVSVTTDVADLGECDLVIESVVESLAVKAELFELLDQALHPTAVLATNTSTLPVVDLAMRTKRPQQVCGIHFFNPAAAMPLVEIVRPITASDATIATATAFATACGKDTVQVKDRAGFIVNALLFPYLNNAIRMLEAGTAAMEDIDVAMRGGCGFPMGPFALLDLVGLDTSLSILDALYFEFRDANYAAVPTLRRMVAAGQLGRKTKMGFYRY